MTAPRHAGYIVTIRGRIVGAGDEPHQAFEMARMKSPGGYELAMRFDVTKRIQIKPTFLVMCYPASAELLTLFWIAKQHQAWRLYRGMACTPDEAEPGPAPDNLQEPA